MEESGRCVVLFAGLGVGHLTPMVELAKLFLRRDRDLSVTIAVPTDPTRPSSASMGVAAANPSISFHHLPPPHYPNPDPIPIVGMLDVLRLCSPSLRDLLRSLPSVAALVVDVFCAHAIDVAAELRVPASLGDMGKEPLHFPGLPADPGVGHAVHAAGQGGSGVQGAGRAVRARLGRQRRAAQPFEWLEPRAVKALRDGACNPGRLTPPVYCVGPLVAAPAEEARRSERHACLAWLDAQPDRSVVFLCFGSLGAVSAPQLKEIARGMEASGHRFLWVVRNPPDPSKFHERWAEPDLAALLPDGFLERTRDRGLVVPSWAPQVEVLRHSATGAFVTHCGWNSTLEGVAAGVPLLCWPQFAEQSLNKVFIVDEMKVGVVMEGYDEEMVRAEEVEAKVRLVMGSGEGERLRERLAVAKEKAAEALVDGGPSRLAFDEFLKDLAGSK
ncbi:hypothetical protein PR202_gb04842 [Eleusine coracana subsp. coracana]|uniref:Glycosyltransferase n=1 Tax=Eleusine coracana subsp. coracana TaxID=191504 RepID=A0AAV5E6D3_ELECO|nr:hypothetical protein PR202_gb04842 [Eleusine coracana subsp. coracana]